MTEDIINPYSIIATGTNFYLTKSLIAFSKVGFLFYIVLHQRLAALFYGQTAKPEAWLDL